MERHETPDQALSPEEALEVAYRFVAGYYDYARMGAIRRLLDVISWADEQPASGGEPWAAWQACVRETLAKAPLPDLPPVWDV